jgi:hypothetical protein
VDVFFNPTATAMFPAETEVISCGMLACICNNFVILSEFPVEEL